MLIIIVVLIWVTTFNSCGLLCIVLFLFMLLGCCYSYLGLLVWCDLLFILVLNAGCWFVVLNLVVVFYWFVSVGLFGYVCCGWFNCYFVGCGCLGLLCRLVAFVALIGA